MVRRKHRARPRRLRQTEPRVSRTSYPPNNHITSGAARTSTSQTSKLPKKLGLESTRAIICCAAFLLAALIKFIAPESTRGLREFVFGEIHESMDYKEAFSTIGEAISSTDKFVTAFGKIYVAVFGEDEVPLKEDEAPGQLKDEPTLDTQFLYIELPSPGEASLKQFNELASSSASAEKAVDGADGDAADTEEAAEALAPITLEYEYPELGAPADACLVYADMPIGYVTPVHGEISSSFGYRLHPILDEVIFHNGLDITASEGTDVLCYSDGYVRAAGEHENLGKYLIVTHSNGIETLYAHLSEWYVTEGSGVLMGQVIAAVGMTGGVTGPHLHFELYIDGIKYNPLYYITP